MTVRAVAALLVLAAVAGAQDEFCETVWIISEEGELLGWPDPQAGAQMEQTFKPVPIFRGSPLELVVPSYVVMALALVPGPLDLASLCDAERHLRKTNQMFFDESIRPCLWPAEEAHAVDEANPLVRRALLDRLLLLRLAERRGLRDVADGLDKMAKSESVDPITRLAAREAAAMLRDQKAPVADLPPLDGIPADAGILVVVDQRRIPPWRDVWRLVRTEWTRNARQTIARVGAAVTPADLCFGQWLMDRESERFYEIARRFGNARVHRTVLALRFAEENPEFGSARVFLRCEGLFDVDRFREACVALGLEPAECDKAVSVRFGDVDVTEAATRLVATRNYPAPAEGGAVPADLAKLGLGGDDAIWIHCRQVPFGGSLPVKGVQSLTLRANFEGGVTARVEATFRDEAAARAAKAQMDRWTPDLTPVELREADARAIVPLKSFVESLKVSTQGATLVAQASAAGATLESLFAGVIELQALYACD